MRQHAYEEGGRLFRLAIDVGTGHLDDVQRCRLLLGLGAALHLSSDIPGGLQACQEAAGIAGDMGHAPAQGQTVKKQLIWTSAYYVGRL